ncbi:MAG: hypothetical protein GY754_32920 [bacterium]|nr:hypothetical protein [bacterium]
MDIKKAIYCFVSVIIIAVIVNFITGPGSNTKHEINDNGKKNSIKQLSSETWEESGIDLSRVNITDIEMVKMIDEVVVEKNPVCSGEDFLVSVKAENPRGKTNTLNYRISGKKGDSVILNYKAPGEKKIHIFVRDTMNMLDHKEVAVRVIKCENRPMAQLKSTFSSSRLGEINFEVIEMQGLEGSCVYKWDFGDGKSARTNAGIVSHNYGNREQKSFTSNFLATVSITDKTGTSITARKEVTFPNIQWISSRMGTAVIPITYDRIAVPQGDTYIVKIKIKNIFDMPLNFFNAHVTCLPCSGKNGAEMTAYPSENFISKTSLDAGEYAKDTLVFNKNIFPDSTCTVKIKLVGELSNGRIVTSPLYITVPMSKESIKEAIADNRARVITGTAEIDKIRSARRILGTKFVTPEDIYKLEKEGKL